MKIKEAARNLLRWNLKGQATGAKAKRGIYIRQSQTGDTCYACKIGLVMLGRWSRRTATDGLGEENSQRVSEIQRYGPMVACPEQPCWSGLYDWQTGKSEYRRHMGSMIEHLFESHKWSVMRIDKWLAEKADLDLAEEREKVGV